MKFYVYCSDADLIPTRANPMATGMDIRSADTTTIPAGSTVVLRTGLELRHERQYATAMPVDVQVRGRSGLSSRGLLVHLGTIDADYEGELGVIMTNLTGDAVEIPRAARVAQLVFPAGTRVLVMHEKAPAVSGQGRGAAGFGSTGTD